MKTALHHLINNRLKLSTLSAYYELTKPGITFLVLSSMLMGFVMGSGAGINFITLFHAVIGTYLIAAGTAAHNQFIERNLDKMMDRTSDRPIPANRISPRSGFIFSMALILGGLIYLLLMVNVVAGLVSLATTVIYLAVYTPMKQISAVNVIIGSIPGALPPVGGWAAATGSIADPGMWFLFTIVFLWQIPHVLAIAWLCNDDYTKAGFQMLPKNDASGIKTSWIVNISLLLLLPVTWWMFNLDLLGYIFLAGAALSALGYLYYGITFGLDRTKQRAKSLMFASFIYLPLVWLFIFVDLIFNSYLG